MSILLDPTFLILVAQAKSELDQSTYKNDGHHRKGDMIMQDMIDLVGKDIDRLKNE